MFSIREFVRDNFDPLSPRLYLPLISRGSTVEFMVLAPRLQRTNINPGSASLVVADPPDLLPSYNIDEYLDLPDIPFVTRFRAINLIYCARHKLIWNVSATCNEDNESYLTLSSLDLSD